MHNNHELYIIYYRWPEIDIEVTWNVVIGTLN